MNAKPVKLWSWENAPPELKAKLHTSEQQPERVSTVPRQYGRGIVTDLVRAFGQKYWVEVELDKCWLLFLRNE